MQIDNIWHTVPFVDADPWEQYVKKFGMPVVDRDRVNIPRYLDRGLPFQSGTNQSIWLRICQLISTALGLPSETYAHTLGHILQEAIKKGKPSDVQ
jgi:hypothetical protein